MSILPIDATPTTAQLDEMRERIAYFGRMLFDRQLTDAAGGNISARIGNRICITPRYAGQQRQWRIDPGDVLVADLERNVLRGSGALSRETHSMNLQRTARPWSTRIRAICSSSPPSNARSRPSSRPTANSASLRSRHLRLRTAKTWRATSPLR